MRHVEETEDQDLRAFSPNRCRVRTAALVRELGQSPLEAPPWDGSRPFWPEDVHERRARKQFEREPYDLSTGVDWDHSQHLARVAWLMDEWTNNGSDPLLVEFVPFPVTEVVLVDGWHRLAVAIIRADEFVWIDLSGDLDAAEDTFDVTII